MVGQKFPLEDRTPVELTVLPSAVRAATNSSADFVNYKGRGLKIFLDVTVVPGVDTVTFDVEAKDPVSGKYVSLLTSAALVATGLVVLTVHPGIAAAANVSASDAVSRTWRVTATHSAATNFTYSVGAAVLN